MDKRITLRIPTKLYLKIEKMSKKEKRKVTPQINYILEKAVTDYEEYKGLLDINETDKDN